MWKLLKGSLISLNLVLIILTVNAQDKSDRIKIGFYGGTNFSYLTPEMSQSVIVGNMAGGEKSYNSIKKNQGWQFGGLMRVDIVRKLLTLSFEPLYVTRKFGYSNSYAWEGVTSLTREVSFENNLTHLEAPLFLELKRGGKRWEPYFKIGGYYGVLQNAITNVESRELNPDFLTGEGISKIETISSKTAFVSTEAGIGAGVGIRCNLGGVKIGLDFTYRYSLQPLSNTDTRFKTVELVGEYYDTADDFGFQNMAVSIQILTGLNFKGDYAGPKKRGVVPCPGH